VTRSELDDERSFLLDSLEDLDREKEAGDLSEADYVVLRDRYTRRAAAVLRALERDGTHEREAIQDSVERARSAVGAEGASELSAAAPRRRARRKRGLLVMGLVVVVGAVGLTVVLTETGSRLPGQTATGTVSLSRGAQERRTLSQAESLEASGNSAQALRLYLQVLGEDPTQPEALAQSGWLEFEAGAKSQDSALLSRAQGQEQAAVRADPGAYAPRLYLGSMLLAEGDVTGAVAQYRQFLADGPPPAEVEVARPFITQAFGRAGLAVPAMPGTASSTTPSTSPATTARPGG